MLSNRKASIFLLHLLVFSWWTLHKICNLVSCQFTLFCCFHIICFPFRFAGYEFSLQNGKPFTTLLWEFGKINIWNRFAHRAPVKYLKYMKSSFPLSTKISIRSMFHYIFSMNHYELNQGTTIFGKDWLLIPFSQEILNHYNKDCGFVFVE